MAVNSHKVTAQVYRHISVTEFTMNATLDADNNQTSPPFFVPPWRLGSILWYQADGAVAGPLIVGINDVLHGSVIWSVTITTPGVDSSKQDLVLVGHTDLISTSDNAPIMAMYPGAELSVFASAAVAGDTADIDIRLVFPHL